MDNNLIFGYFVKRYKRFLVDVKLSDDSTVTAHCTNSGSLKSCLIPGAKVAISPVDNPNRKTKFTWQMILINGTWVGVNTNMANILAYNLLKEGQLPRFQNLKTLKTEVKFHNSRIDLYAETTEEKFFIEVKNVTYRKGRYALFPDAPTTRGQKHLKELMLAIDQGYKAAMFFVIQRADTDFFAPAWEIDPVYSNLLLEARGHGVEIYPLQFKLEPGDVQFYRILPFVERPES